MPSAFSWPMSVPSALRAPAPVNQGVRLLIKRMKIALRLVLLILAVTPLLAWFAVKPVRVVAPTVAGLICPAKFVCVEAAEKLPEATALYEDAVMFARKQVGPLQGNPSVVFCSTKACTENFGLAGCGNTQQPSPRPSGVMRYQRSTSTT